MYVVKSLQEKLQSGPSSFPPGQFLFMKRKEELAGSDQAERPIWSSILFPTVANQMPLGHKPTREQSQYVLTDAHQFLTKNYFQGDTSEGI